MLNITEIRQPLPRRSLRTPKEVRLDELLNSPFITLRIDDVPVGLKLKDACRAMANRGRRDAASDMLEEVMTAFRDIDRLCDRTRDAADLRLRRHAIAFPQVAWRGGAVMSTRRELADRFAMLQRGGTLPGDQGDEMLRRMVAAGRPKRKETRRDMIMRHAAAPLSEAARAHIARVRSEPIDELPDYDIPVAQPPQSKAKAVNLEVNEELRQRRQPVKSRRERRKLTAPQPSAVTPTKTKRKHADNEFIVSILGDRSTTEACELVGEAGRIARQHRARLHQAAVQ